MHDPAADAMDPRWQRIAAVLDQVLEAPTRERARLLQQLVEADAGLHAEVVRLLEAADRDDGVLDRDAGDYFGSFFEAALTRGEETLAADQAPQRVGPWRVLSEIGRGGMGVVYRAERADGDFEQQVALKLLKRGLDTEAIIRRFHQERRILARLTHPAIARLIDGGVADDGRPYLAMELVEGATITAWCNHRRMPLQERLRIFQRVCDAVHYAHANLVVHRDLKPSNILVTEEGDLKLLDFGIAKLLSEEGEAEATEWTRMGVRAMTPEYAAPEQVRGDPVSTATDVYALGLILYELLTGERAFQARGRSRQELEREIVTADPTWPSRTVTRRASDGQRDGAESAAAARGLKPGSLRSTLAGDLDAIVMKTLRKEPRERYASAQALAEDLGRYLAQQPIAALPESRLYRAGKFVRRHRLGVAAAAFAVLSLAGGLGVAVWQGTQRAAEARKAERVTEFLIEVFGAADPAEARGREITVRELLDRGAQRVESELREERAVELEMLVVLGTIHRNLGLLERAEGLLERAQSLAREVHGSDSERLASVFDALGLLRWEQGRAEEAERLHREALTIRRRRLGDEAPEVSDSLTGLAGAVNAQGRYDEGEELHRQALATDVKLHGREHPRVASDLNNLAWTLWRKGDLEQAAENFEEALALRRRLLGAKHPELANTMTLLGAVRSRLGEHAAAERLQRQALEVRQEVLGEDHPDVAISLDSLATTLERMGRYDEAVVLNRQALELRRRTLGDAHRDVAQSLNNLAILHYRTGNLEAAAEEMREVHLRWRASLGPEHPHTATALSTLGRILIEQGEFDEAGAALEESLDLRRAIWGERHQEVAISLNNLGLLARAEGRFDDAQAHFREALSIFREALPHGHTRIAEAALGLGITFLDVQDPGAAEELLQEAFAIRRDTLGDTHWQTAEAGLWVGVSLARLGRVNEATTVLRQSLAVLETERGFDHQLTRRARAELQALGSL